ncbi:MAG TPA: fatty acyl-AMP ligase, partial [Ktedonobacterales bacterium]|nr:fatty acyl-AMP ligase [Ktedonobacterales bacterium]
MNSSPVLPGPSDARSNGPWKAVRKLLPWRRPEKELRPQTLVDVVRWRAEVQPDDLACMFLPDGDGDEVRLSYRDIDQQARSIGAWLQEQGAGGSRVLLLYPPGKDYVAAFLGCLYAGAVAVPAYPPRSNQLLARLQLIAEDTKAPLALTTNQVLAKVERQIEDTSDLKRLRWLATDGVVTGHEARWKRPAITGDSLAFLQYTSGTTARPKGVMISHSNLIYNAELIRNCFETTRATHGLFWLPLYHDMGLIGGVVQPLYGGCPVTFMSPVSFLHRPLRWLEMISRYRATVSGGPNFAYDLCVSKATPEHIAALDLSCWEIAFTGAEPIRAETMVRFSDIFGSCGFRREAFYPCYGLAESVVMVSGGKRLSQPVVRAFDAASLEYHQVAPATDPATARMLVGCGQTRLDQKIVIVNPDTMAPCAANEVGEIWVAGPSVAKGYWNQPELTQHAFEARLSGSGEGPFLRTGDLGFLGDNDLFVTGRIKDLIIIRGRNYYPQDIELTVEQCHPAVRRDGSAAFAAEVDEQERLV